MRASLLMLFGMVVAVRLDAATIRVQCDRARYDGPLEIRLGVRRDYAEPRWFAYRSLPGDQSEALFRDVPRGSYTVLVSGAEPLQRLAVETGVGADDVRRLHIALPAGVARGRITRGGAPLANASVELHHLTQYWSTKTVTDRKSVV